MQRRRVGREHLPPAHPVPSVLAVGPVETAFPLNFPYVCPEPVLVN
eukprot:COSAG06_NODE_6447_length_2927_cov_117.715700_3_plen_46_part_00